MSYMKACIRWFFGRRIIEAGSPTVSDYLSELLQARDNRQWSLIFHRFHIELPFCSHCCSLGPIALSRFRLLVAIASGSGVTESQQVTAG